MRIAFDALPLLGQKTGVGSCEAGQILAMTSQHPEDRFFLQYFALRHREEHSRELSGYLRENVEEKRVFGSGYLYRAATSVLPVPYRWFFGESDVTHFFNYIVPPGVGGKTVVTVHDMVIRAYPETVRGRTRWMLETGLERSMKRCDRIVTDSKFSKKEIEKYYPEYAEKIRVVPCGVDRERFSPVEDEACLAKVRERYHTGEKYFLYLGTIEPRKNLERLLDAYAILAQSTRKDLPRLVLAGGKGWLCEGVFDKVKTLHLEERVTFTEYVAGEDVPALMSGAEAFLFPSLYEGFGMPPLEAMACGTPVLAAKAASLPEVCGDAAVYVPPEDTKGIARGLWTLWNDAPLRASLRARGRERARALTWAHSAQRLYEVYEELHEERART